MLCSVCAGTYLLSRSSPRSPHRYSEPDSTFPPAVNMWDSFNIPDNINSNNNNNNDKNINKDPIVYASGGVSTVKIAVAVVTPSTHTHKLFGAHDHT